MKTIPFYQALLAFNERVLEEGSLYEDDDHIYTPDELNNKLKFNQIFLDNMTEMFQKYPIEKIRDSYIKMHKKFNKNIRDIYFAFIKIEGNIFKHNSNNEIILGEEYNDISKLEQNEIYYLYIDEVNSKVAIYDKVIFSDKVPVYRWSYDLDISYFNINGYLSHITPFKLTYKGDPSIKNESHVITRVEFISPTTHRFEFMSPLELANLNDDYTVIQNLFNLNDNDTLIQKVQFLSCDSMKHSMEKFINNENEVPVLYNIDFNDIEYHDVLLEFPKYSFNSFLNLLSKAADMPNSVESISMSLYRIGDSPRIPLILKNAANNGIDVYVNMEMNASGEFTRNDEWKNYFIDNGIHVSTFGDKLGIKVHSKICLIKFKNGDMIAQIGTGNYHTITTKLYTDLSLVTSDKEITRAISYLFDYLRNVKGSKSKLESKFTDSFMITGFKLKKKLLKLINKESKKGSNGYICIKCNSLNDTDIIEALDSAALCGCRIYLIVRGACTWIPDSYPNVTIKSIIWDKLEHSRIYVFGLINPIVYIGSLDPVTSKFENRIETLVKIKDPDILIRVLEYVNKYIINYKNSWIMKDNGKYIRSKKDDRRQLDV